MKTPRLNSLLMCFRMRTESTYAALFAIASDAAISSNVSSPTSLAVTWHSSASRPRSIGAGLSSALAFFSWWDPSEASLRYKTAAVLWRILSYSSLVIVWYSRARCNGGFWIVFGVLIAHATGIRFLKPLIRLSDQRSHPSMRGDTDICLCETRLVNRSLGLLASATYLCSAVRTIYICMYNYLW